MKNRSRRGAARISAVWMIAMIVVAIAAMAFAYIAQQEATAARQAEARAARERDEAVARFDSDAQTTLEISRMLGFYPEDVTGAYTELDAARAGLDALKAAFSDLDDTVVSFEDAVPIVIGQYSAALRSVGDLQGQITQLQGEVKAIRGSLDQVTSTKDEEIRGLQQQLSDAQNQARQQQQELEGRVASITTDRNERDTQLRGVRGQLDDLQRELERTKQASETRFNQLTQVLQFTRTPNANEPDGEVLAVSKDLGMAWIDLGARNRLSRGMGFDVVSGNPNSPRVKGHVEVADVESDRAQVRITEVQDRFDPIVPGDRIVNPLYDPSGVRNAVLIGRFSGDYTRKDLEVLLGEIGIKVQSQLTPETAYLIVGSEIYEDETGEPLEEPVQPSELPIYRDARAQGVQIVPLQEVRKFFKR